MIQETSTMPPNLVTCPNCGSEDQPAGGFCANCGRVIVRLPDWAEAPRPKGKLFTRRRAVVTGVVLFLLAFVVWINFPFFPDPIIILFKRPVSQLTSNSLPGQWAMSGGDLQQTRRVDEAAAPLSGRVLWSKNLGIPTRSAPIIVDDIMYLGGNFKVMALDATTGAPIWVKETTGPIHSSLAAAGDYLYLGLLDHRLLALDRETGEPRWEYQTSDTITASPVVNRGIVYFGSWDKFIYALDAVTGELIWNRQVSDSVRSQVAISDGALFSTDNSGNLEILNARTGQERLRFRTSGSTTAAPTVANGLVYFTSGGRLFAVDAGSREAPGQFQLKKIWAQLWLWQVPGVGRPPGQQGGRWRFSPDDPSEGLASSASLSPEALYVGDVQGIFYARDADRGAELWKFQAEKAIVASPLIVGDRVYFGDRAGVLYSLDRFSGELIWRLPLGNSIEAPPVFANGRLYVRTNDGRLHAVE